MKTKFNSKELEALELFIVNEIAWFERQAPDAKELTLYASLQKKLAQLKKIGDKKNGIPAK